MDWSKRVLKADKIQTDPAGSSLYDKLRGRPGVSTLIKWFYAKVRFDPQLQPIFDAHIQRWGPHLEILIDFWSEQMGGPAHYNGNLGRHQFLALGPEHFAIWLRYWEENSHWLLPEPEAEAAIALAHRLARELQS